MRRFLLLAILAVAAVISGALAQPEAGDSLPNIVREGRRVGGGDAARLEQRLAAEPGDLEARARLLGYYGSVAVRDISRRRVIEARRRHILWIIDNQPASMLASLRDATISPTGPFADKPGYEQARALWLRQVEAHPSDAKVLANAAMFLQLHDKPLAESVLDKARAAHPGDASWDALRGYLYALAILGVDGLNPNGIPVSVNAAEQDGAFARKALRQAQESRSAVLAGTTGAILAQFGMMIRAMGLTQRSFDVIAEKLLVRAQSLDPASPDWSGALGQLYELKVHAAASPQERARWSGKAVEQMEKGLAHTTDPKWRKGSLSALSKAAFNAGAFDKAEKHAKELLALAEAHAGDPTYGDAVHDGNVVLGRLALRRNDVRKAKEHLARAAEGATEASGTLSSFGPNVSLANDLLERGEKDAVIAYFEACKKFWTYPRNPLDRWIAEVRAGKKPNFGGNLNY